MAADSLRLDQILRRDIAVAWLEGIAVVQTICRELPNTQSASARFPLAMEVALTAGGGVSLLRSPSGAPGVVAAGQLLGELLQGDVPVRLRLIQSEAVASSPVFHTIKELSDALAYFERPDTPQLIQQLFARAEGIPDSLNPTVDIVEMDDFLPEEGSTAGGPSGLSINHEAEDLQRQRLVQVDATPRSQQDTMALSNDAFRARRRNLPLIVGLVGAVILASGAYFTGRERVLNPGPVETEDAVPLSSAATAPTTGAGATRATKPASDVKANARPKMDSKAQVDSGVGPARVDSGRAREDATGTASIAAAAESSPVPAPTASTPPAFDTSASPILPLVVQETVNGRSVKLPPIVDESGELLYSRVNTDVVPPTAIRPHLPSEPPLDYAADHLMVLELVITGKGDVESVRLLTAPKTVNDFMIVSAAKAWLFAPAKLNGRPVKYRHRIRFVVP